MLWTQTVDPWGGLLLQDEVPRRLATTLLSSVVNLPQDFFFYQLIKLGSVTTLAGFSNNVSVC